MPLVLCQANHDVNLREPFAFFYSERSEESDVNKGKLRSRGITSIPFKLPGP